MHSTKDGNGQAKTPKRQLGHLKSITEGGNFTAKPNFLEDLLLDGKIDVAYYRLITVMLRHADTFHIKEPYLRKRFCHKTLKRLKAKLVEDGIVVWEKVNGKNVYHTNPIHMWKLEGAQEYAYQAEPVKAEAMPDDTETPEVGQNVERGVDPTGCRPHGVQTPRGANPVHKKTKLKKTKLKKTNDLNICGSPEKSHDNASKSSITKKRLVGEYQSCFKYGASSVCEAQVDYLLTDCKIGRDKVLAAILKFQDSLAGVLNAPSPQHKKALEDFCLGKYESTEAQSDPYNHSQPIEEKAGDDDRREKSGYDFNGVL